MRSEESKLLPKSEVRPLEGTAGTKTTVFQGDLTPEVAQMTQCCRYTSEQLVATNFNGNTKTNPIALCQNPKVLGIYNIKCVMSCAVNNLLYIIYGIHYTNLCHLVCVSLNTALINQHQLNQTHAWAIIINIITINIIIINIIISTCHPSCHLFLLPLPDIFFSDQGPRHCASQPNGHAHPVEANPISTPRLFVHPRISLNPPPEQWPTNAPEQYTCCIYRKGILTNLPSYIRGLFHKPWNKNPILLTNQDDSWFMSAKGWIGSRCSRCAKHRTRGLVGLVRLFGVLLWQGFFGGDPKITGKIDTIYKFIWRTVMVLGC